MHACMCSTGSIQVLTLYQAMHVEDAALEGWGKEEFREGSSKAKVPCPVVKAALSLL